MPADFMAENLQKVQYNIAEAAKRSGRNASDITLVAVTKTIDIPRIQSLLDLGVRHLGENRVQEFLPKFDALKNPQPHWHMIGHLQSNKVKYLSGKVCLVHSVDNLRLAQEIDKRTEKLGQPIKILIEVNIANEGSKNGVVYENAAIFAEQLSTLTNIRTVGLMCVAPIVDIPECNRQHFAKMRNLFVDIHAKNLHNTAMKHLSMGMSNDYIQAIEEGANVVRVGTSIFGSRQ